MKALRWHSAGDLRVEELKAIAPTNGAVLIQVAYCGICGSDLHEYHDGPHAIPCGPAHPISGEQAPLTIGHEFCGQVLEIGKGVHSVKPGERVAIEPEYRCRNCRYCKAGQYNLCESMGFIGLMGNGGMAEQVLVPEYMLHVLPDSVSFRQAAVLEPAAVSEHALNQSSLQSGNTCLIIGLGPIGLLLLMLAKLRGIDNVCVVDLSHERLDRARQLGARWTIEGDDPRLIDRLHDLSNGGFDTVFEAAGSQITLDSALCSVKKGGEVVLIGLMGDVTLDAFHLVNNEIRLLTSVGYRDVYPQLIRYLVEGRLDLSKIVTRTVELDRAILDGFDTLLSSKQHIKILVNPNPQLTDKEHLAYEPALLHDSILGRSPEAGVFN